MIFSDEQIEQFRQLHLKRFGNEISKEVAYEHASKLIRMLLLIYKPITYEDYEVMQKERLEMLPEIINHIASKENDKAV